MFALDLTGLRQTIAKVLTLPNDRVRDSYVKALNDKAPYITATLLTSTLKGREYKFNQEKEYITTTREAVVQISAFGRNSVALLDKFNSLLYTSEILKEFKKIKVGLVSVSPIRNLTTNVGGGFEERGSIDLVLSYINRVEVSQNAINTADFEIKVNR